MMCLFVEKKNGGDYYEYDDVTCGFEQTDRTTQKKTKW